ncbi:hypothetical protein [Streptomyces lushanensis]|uniref:hypothetical protein n=1 Tax=Streptomyces lushanensis TaxID=1434255 RepID=UPI0008305616|nr:hypothetical protein [Streptomyces lushanensis]
MSSDPASSRATNRRSDFTTIAGELRQDLTAERVQRKLLTSFVMDLLKWAQRVEPDTQAGPPPKPPADLDLTPWRR